MSKPRTIKRYLIPAFNGGINQKDPPLRLASNECQEIESYLPQTNSIRSSPVATGTALSLTGTVGSLFNWHNSTLQERVIATTESKIYSLTFTSSWGATDITGAVTISEKNCIGIPFNGYLFLVNGTDDIIRIDTSLASSLAAFTGPGGDDKLLKQGCAHNGYLYFVESDSQSFWYPSTELAITGPLTEEDLSAVFQSPGALLFVETWSFNSGASNERFLVAVSTTGEVLVYSGDYPGANNWLLVARTRIPEPLGRRGYAKIGGDLAIYTKLGIVLLSQVVSSASSPASLFTLSDNLIKIFQRGDFPTDDDAWIVVDRYEPLIYVRAGTDSVGGIAGFNKGLWVGNLRTGAWAYEQAAGTFPNHAVSAFNTLLVSRGATLQYQVKNSTAPTRSCKTGWMNFDSGNYKQIKAVKLYSSILSRGSEDSLTYTLRINADFDSTSSDGQRSVSQSVSIAVASGGIGDNENPIETEFDNIGIIGRFFQLRVSASQGAHDEILGFEIEFEEGGAI